ncbi:MAG: RES family NAD+ phosphorylase [Opitutus sp.]
MSTDSGSGKPAPLDVEFRIVPALKQYVHKTKREVVWRIHGHDKMADKPYGPIFFSDLGASRWDFRAPDPHDPYSAGVLCVGRIFEAAIVETFGKQWPSVLAPVSGLAPYASARVLTPDDVDRKYMSRITVPEGLRLFDLTRLGAMSSIGHGLDAWITATKDYATTRTWAQWFFRCKEIDGLIYSSRPGGAQTINFVLFNRPGVSSTLSFSSTRARTLRQWPVRLAKAGRLLNFTVLPPLPAPLP